MGVSITTYCEISDVDNYASEHGKTYWVNKTREQKLDFVERATAQIQSYHKQGLLWQQSPLLLTAILQSLYLCKNLKAQDLGDFVGNVSSGSYSDGIINANSGSSKGWDEWALIRLKNIMTNFGISASKSFSRG